MLKMTPSYLLIPLLEEFIRKSGKCRRQHGTGKHSPERRRDRNRLGIPGA